MVSQSHHSPWMCSALALSLSLSLSFPPLSPSFFPPLWPLFLRRRKQGRSGCGEESRRWPIDLRHSPTDRRRGLVHSFRFLRSPSSLPARRAARAGSNEWPRETRMLTRWQNGEVRRRVGSVAEIAARPRIFIAEDARVHPRARLESGLPLSMRWGERPQLPGQDKCWSILWSPSNDELSALVTASSHSINFLSPLIWSLSWTSAMFTMAPANGRLPNNLLSSYLAGSPSKGIAKETLYSKTSLLFASILICDFWL